MNHYPQEMVAQPAPLLFIQGLVASTNLTTETELLSGSKIVQLTNSQGIMVSRNYPVVNSSHIVAELETQLLKFNVDGIWDNGIFQKSQRRVFNRYRIRFVGNSVKLPPRKEVHEEPSLLSPFHHESDLYPDGIISREWMIKYLHLLPSVFVGIYELSSFESQDEAMDSDSILIDELRIIMEFFAASKTSFVPVILHENSTLGVNRVNVIQTSIKGIRFHSTSDDDYGTFVSNILTSIESNCLDFYNAMDKRLRKKQIAGLSEISYRGAYKETALMARHSFKMNIVQQFKTQFQQCVKFLEHGYENIIELMKGIALNSASWMQFRQLLDIITIHICRAYLLLREANIAYKKFDIHLQNVVSILNRFDLNSYSPSTLSWKTVQLQWLAELCDKCPKELVPTDRPLALLKYLKSGMTKYTLSSLRLPNTAFLYTSAARMKQRYRQRVYFGSTPIKDEYLQLNETSLQISEYIIQYLNRAVRSLTSSSVPYARIEGSIYFRLGEEYFQTHNYAMSSSNFILALISLEREKWHHLTSVVFWRLYQCSLQLKRPHDGLKYLLIILTIDPAYVEKQVTALLKFCDWSVFDKTNFEYSFADMPLANAEIWFDRTTAKVGQKIACFLKIRPGLKCEHFSSPIINSIHCKVGGEVEIVSGPFQFENERFETIHFTFAHATKVNFEFLVIEISLKPGFSLKFSLNAEQVKNVPNVVTIVPTTPGVELTIDTTGPLFSSQEYDAYVVYKNTENEELKIKVEVSVNNSMLKLSDADSQIELPGLGQVSKAITFTAPAKVGNGLLDLVVLDDHGPLVQKKIPFQVISPFICQFRILPLPNYDIKSEAPDQMIQEFALTESTRKWFLESKIQNSYEKGLRLCESSISTLIDKALFARLPEGLDMNLVNRGRTLQNRQQAMYYHHFTTNRLVTAQGVLPLQLQFKLKYKTCLEGSREFEFVSAVSQQNLTLSDPRLLLSIVKRSKTTMVVKYIIENPGEVALQFITRLIHSVDIHLREAYDTCDLAVTPKTRVEINLVGDLNEDNVDGSVKIPRLIVYDRVYQVYLPILVATPELSIASNGDFLMFSKTGEDLDK
ncbi:BA75_02270T0 [Komagataella pastoris]|uniref:BA75_02270T0 n=1 Tax=Komagataella pastoris TaxID=4922 RepID=A0A1B2JB67_PICPA|nr:BA75_02270T0 [Komagataella pastoris]